MESALISESSTVNLRPGCIQHFALTKPLLLKYGILQNNNDKRKPKNSGKKLDEINLGCASKLDARSFKIQRPCIFSVPLDF